MGELLVSKRNCQKGVDGAGGTRSGVGSGEVAVGKELG